MLVELISVSKRDIWKCQLHLSSTGPLCTKRHDVLSPNLMKSQSREIGCWNDPIVMKFDWHLGSADVEAPIKFHVGFESLNPNLAYSRLREMLRQDVCRLSECRPRDRNLTYWGLVTYRYMCKPDRQWARWGLLLVTSNHQTQCWLFGLLDH